eukprot:2556122-Amphidinium_carterae.1
MQPKCILVKRQFGCRACSVVGARTKAYANIATLLQGVLPSMYTLFTPTHHAVGAQSCPVERWAGE